MMKRGLQVTREPRGKFEPLSAVRRDLHSEELFCLTCQPITFTYAPQTQSGDSKALRPPPATSFSCSPDWGSQGALPPSCQSYDESRPPAPPAEPKPLPPYEAPEAPLTAEDQQRITNLLSSTYFRKLRTHLQHATEKLTHAGGDVNERLSDARLRYEKVKEKRRKEGDEDDVADDPTSEEYQRLAASEAQVEAITARLEEKTRYIIDSETKLQGLADSMTQIEKEQAEALRAALGARQTRQQRAIMRANADEDEDSNDEEQEDPAEREARERNARNPPSRKLETKLAEETQKWNALSLNERYAGNNSYIGFYRMVHDSKFPGDDVPPLPHSSTWFEHLEDANTSAHTRKQSHRHSTAESDDDIAIERERISLKCPLTLSLYVDPVRSTKCPHSFEREAIMDMINRSRTTIAPPAARQGQHRIRMVKCPVCSSPLTADDLRPDPVLLRRVRRAQELQEREEDDDHLEGDRRHKDRSTGITLGSDADSDDDAMDVDANPASQRIKPEPLSQAARAGQADESEEDAESDDNEQGNSNPEADAAEEQYDEEQNEQSLNDEPMEDAGNDDGENGGVNTQSVEGRSCVQNEGSSGGATDSDSEVEAKYEGESD
ncbi:uncharacterized protein N7515_005609 [Penicillium bovifimosum]|uniref:peptidylprolyl isomerase n=1 Tax=Penicillium bovifimosum TaxID=126998 RepID=A0A9W9GT20_9EURO|nr:uncharacterized protein N7515_005609 [Penicillium bovifimosum]KAJ5129570.1 hypothetical protein N7515_005609 [Penicillium bovifimosum]